MSNLSDVWHAANASSAQRIYDLSDAYEMRWQRIAMQPDYDPTDFANLSEAVGEMDAEQQDAMTKLMRGNDMAALGHFIYELSASYQTARAKSAALGRLMEA